MMTTMTTSSAIALLECRMVFIPDVPLGRHEALDPPARIEHAHPPGQGAQGLTEPEQVLGSWHGTGPSCRTAGYRHASWAQKCRLTHLSLTIFPQEDPLPRWP